MAMHILVIFFYIFYSAGFCFKKLIANFSGGPEKCIIQHSNLIFNSILIKIYTKIIAEPHLFRHQSKFH